MRLTFLFDASGKVARATEGYETITIAGIAVASGDLDRLRERLPAGAVKWGEATATVSRELIDLALDAAVAVIIVRVVKSKEAWKEFWDRGDEHHGLLSSQTRGNLPYPAKAEPLIRYALYADTAGPLLAECLKRNRLELVDARGQRIVELDVIPDSDVQGAVAIDTFEFLFRSYPERSELLRQLSVRLEVGRVEFKTEEDEPLLLLPDHLAGAVHAGTVGLTPKNMDWRSVADLSSRVTSSSKVDVKNTEFDLRYEDLYPGWRNDQTG